MEWLAKTWAIEDEVGEEAFLKKIFDTEHVVCTDEDVSTFTILNVVADFYIVEIVSIGKDPITEKNCKVFESFPSSIYKPQKIEHVDGKIITYDHFDVIKTHKVSPDVFDKKLKANVFNVATSFVTSNDLFFNFLVYESKSASSGMNTYVQTISNKFRVKIDDHPKYKLSLFNDETQNVRNKVRKNYTIKRTYTPPDIDGREELKIELTCDGVVATIDAYHDIKLESRN